jgi:dethiobiotin synthetase
VILVEGAGGLMSPLGEEEYVADLAYDFRFPLIVVARNALGTINQTLQTLIAAAAFRDGLEVAGIVLNHPAPPGDDPSIATNREELAARCVPPVLAEVAWNAAVFDSVIDWAVLAR